MICGGVRKLWDEFGTLWPSSDIPLTKWGSVTEVIRFAQHENEVARMRALKSGRSYTQSLLKKTISNIPAETKFLGGLPYSGVLSEEKLNCQRNDRRKIPVPEVWCSKRPVNLINRCPYKLFLAGFVLVLIINSSQTPFTSLGNPLT